MPYSNPEVMEMKRLIALVLSCTMLMSSVHLEVFAEEFRETEPVSTAGGTYETDGVSVEFVLDESQPETTEASEAAEETTAAAEETQPQTKPAETEETLPKTEPTELPTQPTEETRPTESTGEETVEPTVSEAPPSDTTLQSGDFYYTALTEGTCAITGYIGSATELVVPEELEGLLPPLKSGPSPAARV